jgi:hypothetical protein
MSDTGSDKYVRAWRNRIDYVNLDVEDATKLVENLRKTYPEKYCRVFKTEFIFDVRREEGWDLATVTVYPLEKGEEWDDFVEDLQARNFLMDEEIRFYNMEYYDALAEEQFRKILEKLAEDDEWVERHLF